MDMCFLNSVTRKVGGDPQGLSGGTEAQVTSTIHMESSRRTWNTLREVDLASSLHRVSPCQDPARFLCPGGSK